MRTLTLPVSVTLGVFHVGLVASVRDESSELLINGLHELCTGLHDMITSYPEDIEISNAHDLARDLLDMEHLLLLTLEEIRTHEKSMEKWGPVSQLLDIITGLRWEIVRRSSGHDTGIGCEGGAPMAVSSCSS